MVTDTKQTNRRMIFRQDLSLPMHETLLSEDELAAEMGKTGLSVPLIRDRYSPLLEREEAGTSPEVLRALEIMEKKLDMVIQASGMGEKKDTTYEVRPVNLSVTGMGFRSMVARKTGDRLLLKLQLPMLPVVNIEMLCEVVRINPSKDGSSGSDVGVLFNYRCKEEEDAIVAFFYEKQRERIRVKSL